MARGRMLPTDIAHNAELALLEPDALAAWLLTIPHFDRDGLLIGNPLQLRGLICPMIISLHDRFAHYVDQWVDANLVVRYSIGGGLRVLFNPHFRIDNAYMEYTKERPSRFPPPPGWTRHKLGMIPEDEGMLERLIYSLDVKNGYRKMLEARLAGQDEVVTESLARAERNQVGTGVRLHREDFATTWQPDGRRSERTRAEEQAQVQSDADDLALLLTDCEIGEGQGRSLTAAPAATPLAEDENAAGATYPQLAAWYSQNRRAQWQIEQLRTGGAAYLDLLTIDELKVVALGYGGFANVLDSWIGGFYEFVDECTANLLMVLIEWLYYYACIKRAEERSQIRDLAAVIKSNMGLSKKNSEQRRAPLNQQQRQRLLDEAKTFLTAVTGEQEAVEEISQITL